jgi:sRNA-binding carbon storage regulator CsrA
MVASKILRLAFSAPKRKNEHRQHVADEIVVERRQELAPEERRESSRRHQRPKHDGGRPSNRGG